MTEKLTRRLAALLALYDLGGSRRAVDTEDVAMRAAQVAPKAFRWRRYPEQVNLEAVRLALKDNKKEAFVTGGIRDGWQLTPAAVRRCEAFRGAAVSDPDADRIRRSAAFRAWKKDGAEIVTTPQVMDLLRVNEYFPTAKRRQRVVAFLNAVGGDTELSRFAAALQRRFPEVMRI